MDSFNSESGRKVAEAIDRRVMNVAKNIYENSPNNKTKFGTVLSSSAGLFSVKIDNVTYTNIPALKNVGNINRGEVVICLVPNNQYSNMIILGVADGTLQKLYGTDIELAKDNPGNITDSIINVNRRVDNILLNAWPVNSVYISVESTSPSSFIGGTWEQLPEGYALWTILTGTGGDTIAPGLPDITGYIHSIVAAATWDNQPTWGGAFTLGKNVLDIQGPQRDGYRRYLKPMDFAASNSNSIYGKSETVQPPAIKVYAWKRVF